ncbi:MAG: SDR family oxidoreductase [Rhodospirillaceae bacterium]|nr:SDR family oxidoreductase [Rhodospirillaceae bacterium]
MTTAPQPVCLVTNATGFAGPPAVDALAAAGYRVLAHDRSFGDAAARARFAADHPGAECLAAASPAEGVAEAVGRAGRLDTLVSNDHHPARQLATVEAPLEELTDSLNRLVVDPFAAIRAAIPHLQAAEAGTIVMVTSNRTRLPLPGGAIPDACRAAVNALVRSLAIELAPLHIPVNAVAPNFLYSEAYYPRAVFIDDPKGREHVKQVVPAGRLAEPWEIGDVIRFLATTKASFLTGAIIDFSGGWPAGPMRPE